MTDTGSTDIFNIEPKKKDIKDIGTEPTKRILSDTGNEIIFETQKQKEPKLLKFDKEKVSDVKTREMFRKQNKESIDKYKNMIPANDFQADKVFAQREQLPINPFPIYKEEQKRKVKQIIEKAPEPSSAMAEIMTRKIIVPKYSDISGNKERMEKQEERIKKQKEEGVRVTKRLSDIGDISNKQLYGSNSPLIIASQKSGNKNPVIETIKNKKNKASVSSFLEADKQAKLLSKDILGSALRDVNKEKKKDSKKESFKAILELDKLQNELLMKQAMEKRKKKDEIKLKEMELEKGKTIKAFNTIAGALKQKVARKKLNELKMDKVGNILHFKKEAAKSIFRDKLKSNTKRFGSKGYVVDVPKSETARLREAVKKEQRALKEKYTGVMKP